MTACARWLSVVAHPFVMVGIMVGAAAARQSAPGEAFRSVLVVLAFTVVPLLALMIRQVRSGAWENVDASNSQDRPMLYLVGGLGFLGLLMYLVLARPQSFLIRGSVVTLAMFAVCAIATRWIKVSLHMAFAALATTTLMMMGSLAGWMLLPVVPALAWSRLMLKRHRPVEVVLGALIGVSAGVAMFFG